MEPGELLPCSKEPATGSYLEPYGSNPHPYIVFFKIYFNIILPPTPISAK